MVLCCFSHIEIFIKILSLQPLRIQKLLHWDGFMLLILNICSDPIPAVPAAPEDTEIIDLDTLGTEKVADVSILVIIVRDLKG